MEKGLTNLRGLCKDKRFCSEVEQAVYMLPSVVSGAIVEGRREGGRERERQRGREKERERAGGRGRWYVILKKRVRRESRGRERGRGSEGEL